MVQPGQVYCTPIKDIIFEEDEKAIVSSIDNDKTILINLPGDFNRLFCTFEELRIRLSAGDIINVSYMVNGLIDVKDYYSAVPLMASSSAGNGESLTFPGFYVIDAKLKDVLKDGNVTTGYVMESKYTGLEFLVSSDMKYSLGDNSVFTGTVGRSILGETEKRWPLLIDDRYTRMATKFPEIIDHNSMVLKSIAERCVAGEAFLWNWWNVLK